MKKALLPLIAFLLLFPGLLSLGFWQLERGDMKSAQKTAFNAQLGGPAVPLETVISKQPIADFTKIKMAGKFINEYHFLLDNQIDRNGRVGYHVLTPLEVSTQQNASLYVLVNRGFIAAGTNRTIKPNIPSISGTAQLTALIKHPADNFILNEKLIFEDTDWPLRIQAIDIKKISEKLPFELLPYVALLTEKKVKYGFDIAWQYETISPEKHYGYAFQWFAMAATLLVIFLINLKRTYHNEYTKKSK